MSEPMTARDHALRVTVLEALNDTVGREYQKARADAEPVFAAVRKDGATQQEVLLSDGEKIGLISIRAGSPTVEADEKALDGYVRDRLPGEIEPYIDPAALQDPDIASYIRAFHSQFAKDRIRPETRKALLDEAADTGGYVVDPETGAKVKVADVTPNYPNGAFSLTGSGAAKRRNRIVAEWRAGRIPEAILGPLALPAGGEPDAARL